MGEFRLNEFEFRNQYIIEKMEQKINQQQIEIFKLKKKLKFLFLLALLILNFC